MSKKNKHRTQHESSQDVEAGEVENAYLIKKLSLSEWQVVDLEISGNQVLSRKERVPDIPPIVWNKLRVEIQRKEK